LARRKCFKGRATGEGKSINQQTPKIRGKVTLSLIQLN
jgi:hypothetical protein